MYGIPIPNYALVNREYPYQELDYFVEHEDFVEILGKRFQKPFVEKPIDGKAAFYLASTKVILIQFHFFVTFKTLRVLVLFTAISCNIIT